MGPLAADFVQEACAAVGTADYTLSGPPASTPYVGFVAAFTTGAKVFYVCQSDTTFKWEIGWGIVTDASPDTLTRNVLASWDTVTLSTSAKIAWGGSDGALRIYCAPIAGAILGALNHHRSATAPAYPIAGMIWEDISGGVTAVIWKHYDGTDWITFPWVINETANTIAFSSLLLSANPTVALGAAPKQYVDQGDRQAIWGLTYANDVSDATNDIVIAAGGAMDSTGTDWMALASALTKRLDAAWAVGTNQGGRTGASIADTDYNVWEIKRVDTGVVDICFEQVAQTTPTLPTNYTLYRKIGWFKRASATIVPFSTQEMSGGGLDFRWTTVRLDVNLSNTLTTSRRTDALSVPLDFSTQALIRTALNDASSPFNAVLCCPDETDAAPSATAVPLLTHSAIAGSVAIGDMTVKTSATGTIAARATLATVDLYCVATRGWQWSRR